MKLEFSIQILENGQISYFIKILPVGAKLFQADRRTDVTKALVDFHNSANAPKYTYVKTNCYGDWKITALNRSKRLLSERHKEPTCLLLHYEWKNKANEWKNLWIPQYSLRISILDAFANKNSEQWL
jgi:hypothetical protein